MPVSAKMEIVGAKEAVRSLNKLEPGLRKQFAADATRIAQPAISEAQRRYSSVGWGRTEVKGLSRRWNDGGRPIFPWDSKKASNFVKIRLESDRRRTSVILIEQRNAGTAIVESAGRKTENALGNALGFIKPRTTRILGPAVFSRRNEISGEMEKAMLEVIKRVEKELK
jgi:hypothetical protein